MTQQQLYFDYFKELTEQHTKLRHGEARGERVFDFTSLDQAFGVLRDGTKPKGFIFRLVMPRRFFRRENQITQRGMACAFLIAKHADQRLSGDQVIVDTLAEVLEVVDQFVARMVGDSRNGHPLFASLADRAENLNFDALPSTSVGDGTYHGYLCSFEIGQPFEQVGECEASAWLDGGITSI